MTKTLRSLLAGVAVLGTAQLQAATYTDATGETFTGAGGGILDISSVEVSHTASDLIFKINVTGDPLATDWGKYLIALDTAPGGDPAGNGWGRPISMPSGMDYWVGSWVDSGNGGELYKYTGAWGGFQSATYAGNPDLLSIAKDNSSVTIQFAYAGLGLGTGSTFIFDVFTSGGGGGDSAVDALSDPAQSIGDWGNAYISQSTLSYTIPVPEPATMALAGIGAASLLIFRRRKV